MNRNQEMVLIGIVLLVFCAFVGTVSAADIYVPDNYEKIQWAVDNASTGDTIIVRDGTYNENVEVSESLTIRSENGAAYCTIDAGGGDAFYVVGPLSSPDGIEYVDSFVFNPHKWMLTNFDCSAYFVKDPGALIQTFEIHPEYLKTGMDAKVKNYRDWGIQLGRRFRALKLWFVLRSYGVKGLQDLVREHIRLAEMFKEWVTETDSFELMAPVNLSVVCFRLNDGRDEDQLEELNKRFEEALNQTGKIFLTHTSLRGKYVLRMAIGARATGERHVKEAWDLMMETAEDLLK